MEELTKDLHRQLSEALNSAFPTYFLLQQLVYYAFGKKLSDLATDVTPTPQCISRVIDWAKSTGNITELVDEAYRENPDNPELSAFVDTFRRRSASARFGVPSRVESLRGIAPRYSTLDEVYVAFGLPAQQVQRADSPCEVKYPSLGLRITCQPRHDSHMAVNLIHIEAPCREKLSLTGAYIGMATTELHQACLGKYRRDPSSHHPTEIVYDPVDTGGCRLRIFVKTDKVDAIFMY